MYRAACREAQRDFAQRPALLLHWKDAMKGTALKESGSSVLKTFFPSIYQSFISVYLVFQPLLLGLFSFSFNGRLAHTDHA